MRLRLSGHGMMLRRKRIFAGRREGLRYDEIAALEGVTTERQAGSAKREPGGGRNYLDSP